MNGTQFWSNTQNDCTLPGCTAAFVTVTKPLTVTVKSQTGTPYPSLKVYAFDPSTLPLVAGQAARYTGFNGTTDANGLVTLTLPQGSYHFRADYDGVQFWSSVENTCTLPGCESAAVLLPGKKGTETVTIDYTYDPLYRLTAADYSTGDFYHYAYDSVGNRLTASDQLSETSYQYDIANRLSSVDGVNYTWDANGNLLNDGVNTYTYDSANRLSTVNGQSSTVSYAYNGLGDRLSQTAAGGVTTRYTLDLNTGLTQVLSESAPQGYGTNTYTYGLGRISQTNTSTEYFLNDALGSVRQLTASNGDVTLAKSYDPYGVVTQAGGTGQSAYGYTGEAQDSSTNLIYLRARFYNPGIGGFITRDPSRTESNLFQYASANPINRTDSTGLNSDWLIGPMSFTLCFDFHSGSHGWSHDADVNFAIQTCRYGFSKDKWDPAWFDFTKPPESAHNLMGWYLYEQGKENMWFDGSSPLTQELAASTLITDVRLKYYRQGDLKGGVLKEFGVGSFVRSLMIDAMSSNKIFTSLPISFFLGSFKYQVVSLENNRIGFRIDNRTDLESGTHVAGRFPGDKYGGSVEELLARGDVKGTTPLAEAINKVGPNGKQVVSILKFQYRNETSNPLGGGGLEQTYTWTEDRSCSWWLEYIGYIPSKEPKYLSIQPWPDYQKYTQNVSWP